MGEVISQISVDLVFRKYDDGGYEVIIGDQFIGSGPTVKQAWLEAIDPNPDLDEFFNELDKEL